MTLILLFIIFSFLVKMCNVINNIDFIIKRVLEYLSSFYQKLFVRNIQLFPKLVLGIDIGVNNTFPCNHVFIF